MLRAKYIEKSAQIVQEEGGVSWLMGLRAKPYEEAKKELMKLNGVGAKVSHKLLLNISIWLQFLFVL